VAQGASLDDPAVLLSKGGASGGSKAKVKSPAPEPPAKRTRSAEAAETTGMQLSDLEAEATALGSFDPRASGSATKDEASLKQAEAVISGDAELLQVARGTRCAVAWMC
jgi:hypothetical protein